MRCLITEGQEYLAKMRMDYESTGYHAGVKFNKDELIVVFKPYEQKENWPVWKSNGIDSYLDTLSFQIIPNKPIFKLKSDPNTLKSVACSVHCIEDFSLINVDYCKMISRVISKDSKALTDFFDLIPKVDAALAEIHSEHTWTIINLYTDSELFSWLNTLDNIRSRQLMSYLKKDYVAYPITRYAEYLNLYYPKSWSILKKYD